MDYTPDGSTKLYVHTASYMQAATLHAQALIDEQTRYLDVQQQLLTDLR